jgi:hypothetical protein
VRQPFQREQTQAGFAHQDQLQRARQEFAREQAEANRGLSREEMASREHIASANRQQALQIAQMGGTIQPDQNGNLVWLDRSGRARVIDDPQNPGQPLKSPPSLSPAAKAYADVIKAQLQSVVQAEASPMTDDTTRAQLTKRRAALNEELLNILTRGIGGAGQRGPQPSNNDPLGIRGGLGTQTRTPPQGAIDALKKDPSLADQFQQKYGTDPTQYLAGGERAQAPRAAPAAATMPIFRAGAEARKSPKEKFAEARKIQEAKNLEDRNQRTVEAFRGLLDIQSYTIDDYQLVQAALRTGKLTPHEKRIAESMLRELEEQRSFAAGYQKGAAR